MPVRQKFFYSSEAKLLQIARLILPVFLLYINKIYMYVNIWPGLFYSTLFVRFICLALSDCRQLILTAVSIQLRGIQSLKSEIQVLINTFESTHNQPRTIFLFFFFCHTRLDDSYFGQRVGSISKKSLISNLGF